MIWLIRAAPRFVFVSVDVRIYLRFIEFGEGVVRSSDNVCLIEFKSLQLTGVFVEAPVFYSACFR